MAMKPDTITIRAQAEAEIDADSADLIVRVEGSSVFSGMEAFKKAKELQGLLAALYETGIDEGQIKLRSVEVDSQSFSLLKSSSAKYVVKIAAVELDMLAASLGVIATQKHCKLSHLKWNYSTSEAVKQNLRSEALVKAIEFARQDAEILGIKILGIYDLSNHARHSDVASEQIVGEMMSSAPRAKKASIDFGFALGHSATVTVDLEAEFRVSPIDEER